jgi:hypothetical protein
VLFFNLKRGFIFILCRFAVLGSETALTEGGITLSVMRRATYRAKHHVVGFGEFFAADGAFLTLDI